MIDPAPMASYDDLYCPHGVRRGEQCLECPGRRSDYGPNTQVTGHIHDQEASNGSRPVPNRPDADDGREPAKPQVAALAYKATRLADVEPERVRWLWPRWALDFGYRGRRRAA